MMEPDRQEFEEVTLRIRSLFQDNISSNGSAISDPLASISANNARTWENHLSTHTKPPNATIEENLHETFQGLSKLLEAGGTLYLQE